MFVFKMGCSFSDAGHRYILVFTKLISILKKNEFLYRRKRTTLSLTFLSRSPEIGIEIQQLENNSQKSQLALTKIALLFFVFFGV